MKISTCKLKEKTQEKLLEYFVLEVTARSAAKILEIQPNSAVLFYNKLRKIISYNLDKEFDEYFGGEIELDESYFGGKRKGKRGRGAGGKIPVFGILKRNGKVYAKIVQDTKTETLLNIIKHKVLPDSIVYTDSYGSYNVLDVSEFKHFRINHSKTFVDEEQRNNHINGIENFWNQAKRVLRKYNGIPKQNFHLFLKECEWRFNYGDTREKLLILKKWIREYNKLKYYKKHPYEKYFK
jgi:transposase